MRIQLTHPVFDRDEYYESASRTVRWVCLGLVLMTYPSNERYSSAVFTLILAVSAFNLAQHSKRFLRSAVMSSRINTLAIDHIFVLGLVMFSGGLASPYYPLFFLLIIAIIASYGIAGFAISLGGQVIILPLLLGVSDRALPETNEFQFIIKIIFLVIFSIVAQASVRSRDEETLIESRFSRRIDNERQRLLSLINSLSDAVLALDEDGEVYLYNAAALELLNTNQDISGRKINELLPLHDTKFNNIDLLELIRGHDRVINRQDLIMIPDDDSEMTLDLTISPVRIFGFRTTSLGGYMVVFRDITKEKSLDQERDEFISVTSHELRTPLAIMEANLSTALLPGFARIDAKARSLLEQAHVNSVFMSSLIQDLTTLSRAERGSLKTERKVIDLKALVEELGRDYRAQFGAKKLDFIVKIDDETKNVVSSEPELREIIQNFLTNAEKYTEKGSVTFTLEHRGSEAVVSVKDTGIGISASDKTKVFGKFYRAEDYRTPDTGGTGLGLYITKKLADHLGLAIAFASRLNHGSTFELHVPYHPDAVIRLDKSVHLVN